MRLMLALARWAVQQFQQLLCVGLLREFRGPEKWQGHASQEWDGVDHRPIWKFPGLKEHLCNCFGGSSED